MKLLIHIGTEKTGSTTIQRALKKNNHLGFVKCDLGKSTNNWGLALLGYEAPRDDNLCRFFSVSNQAALDQIKATIREHLTVDIQKFKGSDYENYVVSSEHIHSLLTTENALTRLKSELELCGFYDIRVIGYLRNPVEIASSLYSTAIKTGSLMESPPPPSNSYFRNICNHKETVLRFEHVFGDTACTFRSFDVRDLYDSSLLKDFAVTTGLTAIKSIDDVKENPSISALGLRILLEVNKLVTNENIQLSREHRKHLVNYLESNYCGSNIVLKPSLVKDYFNTFYESNKWVNDNRVKLSWFNDPKLDVNLVDGLLSTDNFREEMIQSKARELVSKFL